MYISIVFLYIIQLSLVTHGLALPWACRERVHSEGKPKHDRACELHPCSQTVSSVHKSSERVSARCTALVLGFPHCPSVQQPTTNSSQGVNNNTEDWQ